jgi:hypothetical protein
MAGWKSSQWGSMVYSVYAMVPQRLYEFDGDATLNTSGMLLAHNGSADPTCQ